MRSQNLRTGHEAPVDVASSAGSDSAAPVAIDHEPDRQAEARNDRLLAGRSDDERSRTYKRRLVLADIASVWLAVIASSAMYALIGRDAFANSDGHFWLGIAAIPVFAMAAPANHLYQARANERWNDEIRNIARAVLVTAVAVIAIAFAVDLDQLSRSLVVIFVMTTFALLVAERGIARVMFARLRASGRLVRRIVIVGTDPDAVSLLHAYQRNPQLGYEVVGFVGDDDIGQRGGARVLGPMKDVSQILRQQGVTGAVLSLSSMSSRDVNSLTRGLTDEGYHVALSSSLCDIDTNRLRSQELDGRAMLYVEPVIRGGWRAMAKRLFDIVFASLLLLVTLPIMAVAALAIKLDSGGPVLFHQTRVGKDAKLFRLIKFRTMRVDAEDLLDELAAHNEADGPLFKMENDPRITRVGRTLRKLSIDELPQLFCVLAGTMSMVGPRPALPKEMAEWDPIVAQRVRVMPGLTGLWQVSGRSDASFATYKRLDLYYVDNWSLGHDLLICAKTVPVILTRRGAA